MGVEVIEATSNTTPRANPANATVRPMRGLGAPGKGGFEKQRPRWHAVAGAELLGQLHQVLDELDRFLVAILGIFRHHPHQDGGQLVGDIGIQLPRIDRRHVLMMVQLLGRSAFRHGRLASQHVIKGAAQ